MAESINDCAMCRWKRIIRSSNNQGIMNSFIALNYVEYVELFSKGVNLSRDR